MKIDIEQLEFIHPTLRKICGWLEKETGYDFTITSLYRINDNGVHGQLPLRGIDLRCRNYLAGEEIEYLINRNWTYDKERANLDCALLHGSGSSLHFHLQVCDNTTMTFYENRQRTLR